MATRAKTDVILRAALAGGLLAVLVAAGGGAAAATSPKVAVMRFGGMPI